MNHSEFGQHELHRRCHLRQVLAAALALPVLGPLALREGLATSVPDAAPQAGRSRDSTPAPQAGSTRGSASAPAAGNSRDSSPVATAGKEAAALQSPARSPASARRLVVMGGTLTEIVFALGAGDQVIGTDRSSLYPPAARKLPQVGYFRQFSAEGVAALKPDLVIAAAESGPPQAMRALRTLGVPLETLPLQHDLDALLRNVGKLADLLGRPEKGSTLAASIREQVVRATRVKRPVRVIAVSRHAGQLAGAGRGTAADALFQMLGARNLLAGLHKGFKPLSPESLAALRPDVIVTSALSVRDEGAAAFRSEPGLMSTPAVQNGQVIVLDDLLLLGFGPRVGEALQQLADGFARVDAGREPDASIGKSMSAWPPSSARGPMMRLAGHPGLAPDGASLLQAGGEGSRG